MGDFPLIEVRGEPFERGQQYGAQAAELIRSNLEGYFLLFQHATGLTPPGVLEKAREYLEPAQEYAPHLVDEMRGIAQGAGVSLDEVLALNCRTEILSVGAVPLRKGECTACQGECTALFVAPEFTANGQALLAQNWDWADVLRGGQVLLRVQRPSEPKTVLTLTEAGQVGKIGLNSAGVGVCLNFLRHDQRRLGAPLHLMLREALESPRLSLATAAVYRARRADAGNFLLAHAQGEAVSLEATPADVGVLHTEGGLLVHTNHFITPRLQEGDTGILDSTSTELRYNRALQVLRVHLGAITVETLQEVLRDHFHRPNSICRHPDLALPEIERTATLASVIMNLCTGEMHVIGGEPCQGEHHTLTIRYKKALINDESSKNH
jgi:isopenicillin-N N-acyltransferase-like protein